MPAKSVKALMDEGATRLHEVLQIQGRQTDLLRAVAVVAVKIRLKMGDVAGRSQEYRDVMAEMYRRAEIPPASVSTMQAAVRWHISVVLREMVPVEDLVAAGLNEVSTKEAKANRQKDMLWLDISGKGDAVVLLTTMNHALEMTRHLITTDTNVPGVLETIGQLREELNKLEMEAQAMLPLDVTTSAAKARRRTRERVPA